MSPVATILFALQCAFGVTLALGAIVPLATAGVAERMEGEFARARSGEPPTALGWWPLVLLIGLALVDSIPLFWIFFWLWYGGRDVPRAAIAVWRSERSVRMCFHVSMALLLTLPVYAHFS